ncbi:MAG TPA: hypothetical protein VLS49_12495 [Usitatibacter sp.]|nr:hypothetical protein [Usitatibacter sp.]
MDTPTAASDDAQRELERRALRNVRSLVDNLESRERRNVRANLRLLAWLLLGIAIATGVGYAAFRLARGPVETREIILKPAAAPPARGAAR